MCDPSGGLHAQLKKQETTPTTHSSFPIFRAALLATDPASCPLALLPFGGSLGNLFCGLWGTFPWPSGNLFPTPLGTRFLAFGEFHALWGTSSPPLGDPFHRTPGIFFSPLWGTLSLPFGQPFACLRGNLFPGLWKTFSPAFGESFPWPLASLFPGL